MAKIAIMGYGTVGGGVYDIIKKNADKLCRNTNGEPVEIKYILDIRDFDDHPEKELFTKDFNDILNDDEVTVAAEVMGGLHPAYEFTKRQERCNVEQGACCDIRRRASGACGRKERKLFL